MNDQSVLVDQFPYHIVEFVAAGRKPKVRKTDIVATKWLQYDKQKKRVVTRYPPPLYDTEKSNELGSALEELSDAPSTWSTYTVALRGKAVSLGEAYRKHELLTHQKTTLTAESAESDVEAEKRAANLIRKEQFRSAAKSFNDSLRKKGTKRSSESNDSNVVQDSVPGTSTLRNNISGNGKSNGIPPTKKSSQRPNLVAKALEDLTNTSEHGANKTLLNAIV
ncbi:uncharacterized protein LOC116417076 [Nasonia vitripennis]|uniref:Uncharacterized protein n=1 Tax=Nasonia vitripennis TaxID=7425 RepID=A0A7M7QBS7_NASVI|nr:uncharacterized protein LOC116417076 [Nasonia vitripennis]